MISSRRKRISTWALAISTALILGATMFFMNYLIDKIVVSEQQKIAIWADAIHRKADLVNSTNQFFNTFREDQENRAGIIGQAFMHIITADMGEDITFYTDIIVSNQTIPCILTDNNDLVIETKNLDSATANTVRTKDGLNRVLQQDGYTRIPINYYGNDFLYLYHKESNICTQMRIMLDDLVKGYFSEIIDNSPSLPIIITDSSLTKVLHFGNMDSTKMKNREYVSLQIKKMQAVHEPIRISLGSQQYGYVLYEESLLLSILRLFPILQAIIVVLFIIISFYMFNKARLAQSNSIWLGMSKETAHQLGTPISSLMAWEELLKDMNIAPYITDEMNKDISHLERIAQRFSKIGSSPELSKQDLNSTINNFVNYFKPRTSSKIQFTLNIPPRSIYANISTYLFEWVLENLCKNAVDAMQGTGIITITLYEDHNYAYIEVNDIGKGIDPKEQKRIFDPGYTTKERGWGLGLTLTKRIINQYHKGKIELKSSTPGKGSTFIIKLKQVKQ
ncbi:MAG: HAMP domain-containing histidine kinase [Bacteroidales bacterium]|nr:HAMP domain-containing histidine kinase [Bacteroidales bacterium]